MAQEYRVGMMTGLQEWGGDDGEAHGGGVGLKMGLQGWRRKWALPGPRNKNVVAGREKENGHVGWR